MALRLYQAESSMGSTDKRDKGEKLEKTQESKIAAEAELRKELASLTVS